MTSNDLIRRRRARRRGTVTRRVTGNRLRGAVAVGVVVAVILAVGITAAGGAVVYGYSQYNEIAETVVPAESIIDNYSRGGARVLDRNGTEIYQFVDPFGGLRSPVRLDEISDWMVDATIAVEDPNFWENTGINYRGTIRAGVENFAPFLVGGTEFLEGTGGSSITQQLARNVYMTREEREDRSMSRKLREMVIALELTERYDKEQIIEWYLNSISYGNIYIGIEAAAEGYFGKSASELTLAEASLLAGIPQSPARYFPFAPGNFDPETGQLAVSSLAKARQAEVLGLMVRRDVITQEQADEAFREPFVFRQARFDIDAPHFVLERVHDEIVSRWGQRALFEWGLEITTTLDLNLQNTALEILERNIQQWEAETNVKNGAFIALDPHTAQILVYVGSRDWFNEEIEGRNDNIPARNSPGSTLKPFTYMAAFQNLGWGTGTAIMDTPWTFFDGVRDFTPRNPGTGFVGPLTVARSLGSSLNIPANKTMVAVGVDQTIDMYRRVGYTTLDNPHGYGPALTTGGGEITLMDQAIAYSVLAAGGVMRGQEIHVSRDVVPGDRELEPISLLRVVDGDDNVLYEFEAPEERRVVAPEYAYLVSNILSDPANPTLVYSVCPCALSNGYPAAAKTGTSEPFDTIGLIGETWTMGYTPNLVAGTWAGNADNEPIRGLASGTLSLQTWKEFMVAAIEYLEHPPTPFERPSGVVERQVCWPSGRLPTADCPSMNRYTSLFAAETLPSSQQDAPEMYDSWWQRVAIDMRTGLIANDNTPSSFVQQSLRLVLPEDELASWSGFRDWASRHNVLQYLPPAEVPDGTSPVEITSPAANQALRGEVTIVGRADSGDFRRYVVEWGRGTNPSAWVRISQSSSPSSGGELGRWNTLSVQDGEYTIRLLLDDGVLGTRIFAIPVRVTNDEDAPDRDYAPHAAISSPTDHSQLSGRVTITGTADSENIAGYQVRVGVGQNPAQWDTLTARTGVGVRNDVLAQWDTTKVEDGLYVIELIVSDTWFQPATHRVTVMVNNGSDDDEDSGEQAINEGAGE